METLRDANINPNSKVLVRCDLDVPVENGLPGETFRLEQCLPTLRDILQKQAVPVICGHMGRPGGKPTPNLSTEILRPFFDEALGKDSFILLENLRFDAGEEANDVEFAKTLASNGDIFVNESFASSHRAHASIVGVTKFLPSYAGLRLEQEVEHLNRILQSPAHPVIAIVGGAKLESKKPVVLKFVEIADMVLLGGKLGLSWTEGIPSNLGLPLDYSTENKDIGQQTVNHYREIISTARTIIWSGPMGQFEIPEYANGTKYVAEAVAAATMNGAFSVVGGGDTIAALQKFGYADKFTFVSSGGSAMLDFLVDGTLPGLKVLGF